jgi:flagellar M-ring protein FliF
LRQQLDMFLRSLSALGARRLMTLAAIFVALMAGIGVSAVYLNKPAFETLYVGLDRDDVNRVGIALSEAGFKFDVDSTGTSVLVEAGAASRARMILAEKGLPASSGAGYELFDNLGSLGLTSFMQEVTRVRALEGEIARSIQAVNGVKAARVHIVMPDRTAFRDREKKPTASILIKADADQITGKSNAIRHLVAAAVPGLSSDDVTIMDSEGNLLASGHDQFSNALSGALDTQRNIEADIERKIGVALGPQLGSFNYRVSVQAQIDTDRSTIQETTFDPATRVERSVQVVRAEDSSTQKAESQSVSVEQNLPQTPQSKTSGPVTDEKSQKREETTNYEISSKQIATERNGYRIERLAISVVLNKTKIDKLLGAKAKQPELEARLAEIRKVVSTAAGIDTVRGDKLNVSALEFVDEALEPADESGIFDTLATYGGTAINAGAYVVVSLLILFLGIRPALKAVTQGQIGASGDAPAGDQILIGSDSPENPQASGTALSSERALAFDALVRPAETATKRLRAMALSDPQRAAQVIRKWLAEEAA